MKTALHNLTHDVKLSCNQGELIPIGLVEALPGDKVDHSVAALIRTQPLVTPVMHKCDVKIHHWFVPTRLLWEDFEDFITGGPDGEDASVAPTIDMGGSGAAIGSLADYFGVPTGVAGLDVSALPFRAYALIYNNFYRDQDLQTELAVSLASGVDSTTSTALQNACWEKDYFTSARLTPQKGPAVTVPLLGDAPVSVTGASSAGANSLGITYSDGIKTMTASTATVNTGNGTPSSGTNYNLFADLADASGVDINDLRLATGLQRYMENMSRFGSRYKERIMAAFGVLVQDSRLQLPEYLGGGQQTIQFSEVLATAEGTNTDVGDLKGHGIAALRSNRYRKFIPEHGFILSLMVVRPRTQYVQGLNRMWSRSTKEDYFQPELQNLGQQEVYYRELYAAHSTPAGIFGYQDRYDEYRRCESRVAGEFRSTSTLADWHMARIFTSDPALNSSFVTANPTNRIYASTGDDQLYIMAQHNLMMKRRIARYAKPMLF